MTLIPSPDELWEAVFAGDLAQMRRALELGADPDGRFPGLQTTLLMHMAGSDHLVEKARLLIAFGANVNAVNEVGQTALALAARNNAPAMIRLLLASGAQREWLDHRLGWDGGEIWRNVRDFTTTYTTRETRLALGQLVPRRRRR